ncbi:MAG TPA: choice-of-anchor V domain-containing protein, partial [Bryobacteraceae bacterium]|nr:choice-of-anchor V domain-containing protein [Bryobacteraceae bacterium]
MRNNHRLIKLLIILSAIPFLILAYEFGPPPGVTGAPGDNKTGCIESGCHVGTPNSGGGNIRILLPAGNSGTYAPGQAMQIMVQITDTTMKSYGFQLTARSGAANTTQAGDFTTTDANTQVMCPDSSIKANGKLCDPKFPIQYIEHTQTGWSSSIGTKGSYTYSFNWTPPATAVGNITLYVAANCGTGTASVSPTHVYISSMALTPGAGGGGPTISNVLDAASFRAAVVPGSWVAIFGQGMSATTRTWAAPDFNGNNLPSSLSGVSVNFGTLPASVYYISPTQLDVQV